MSMAEKIKARICENINVDEIEIVNESHLHKGHAGDDGSGETHFKLKVVSSDFKNLTKINAQRLVNKSIFECFNEGLHAVSMKLEH
ncbi:MAG: BolA family protein [Bdellovibrionales bacterium]